VACSSDKAEVVDLYDIDTGEEIVVLPSAELKIPKNLDVLPEPTPGGENLIDPVKK